MRRRILFACNSYPPALGGGEKVCKDMVDMLKDEGYDVTIITRPNEKRNDKDVIEMKAKTSYSIMPNLPKFLDTHDFDLYITFGYGKFFSDYIGWWCKKYNKPSIFMPCGFFHTSQDDWKKKLYSEIMTKWSFNNFKTIITATSWERHFWGMRFNVNENNISVIPYNLPKGYTKFKETNILKENTLKSKQYILYIGRAGPNKLIQFLIDQYNHTRKDIPLIIAGKGTDKYPAGENIRILGEVSENDKKTLIKNAALCVFPSDYESFGMVLLECIAFKTPVIGSQIGPFIEILADDKLLFENRGDHLGYILETVFRGQKLPIPILNIPNQKALFIKTVNEALK